MLVPAQPKGMSGRPLNVSRHLMLGKVWTAFVIPSFSPRGMLAFCAFRFKAAVKRGNCLIGDPIAPTEKGFH
jgi:hypothetical protein